MIMYLTGSKPVHPSVAIVGTRRPTPEGVEIARNLARTLAINSVSVISGLARGIDAAAHRGALEGSGHTLAVLPCGINTVYPTSHHNLAKNIINNQGSIVSEMAGDYKPMPYDFLARNRNYHKCRTTFNR